MILNAGILALLASYAGSMHWLKITHERIYTDKTTGLRVLLISDLHASSLRKPRRRIWDRIHAIDFDIAAITGDLLQDRLAQLEPIKPEMKRLAERGPVYYVDGNHERLFYKELFPELEKLGVTVLYNRRIAVSDTLEITGISDYYRHRRNGFAGLRALFSDADNNKFQLVLSHQPQIINLIKDYSPDLLLCGHTHGGQVRLPLLPALYAPGQGLLPALDHGWYRLANTDVFISKGIGATHFNVRLFNRPEVSVVEVCGNRQYTP